MADDVSGTVFDEGTVFDKAEWHSEGDFPGDLSADRAATHIGLFLGWAIARGHVSEDFELGNEDAIEKFEAHELSAGQLILDACDGTLTADELSAEGARFAADYYDEEYMDDYVDLSDDDLPSIYHEGDSPAKREAVYAVLDARFAEWQ